MVRFCWDYGVEFGAVLGRGTSKRGVGHCEEKSGKSECFHEGSLTCWHGASTLLCVEPSAAITSVGGEEPDQRLLVLGIEQGAQVLAAKDARCVVDYGSIQDDRLDMVQSPKAL